MANVYIATAYRFGWTNAYSYVVAATTSKAKALSDAEDEQQGRGGKYGVEVKEHSVKSVKLVAYFPSFSGESEPHMNWREDAALHVGYDVMDAYENGERVAGSDGLLHYRKIRNFPKWLAKMVGEQEQFACSMFKAQKDYDAKCQKIKA